MTTNKNVEEIAQIARERIKNEAFHKTETGHAIDLTLTREIIIEALTSHTNTVLRQQLEEILVIVQEDIDFGAKHQQIVSTKAQAKILTLLSLLNDQIISNEEKI